MDIPARQLDISYIFLAPGSRSTCGIVHPEIHLPDNPCEIPQDIIAEIFKHLDVSNNSGDPAQYTELYFLQHSSKRFFHEASKILWKDPNQPINDILGRLISAFLPFSDGSGVGAVIRDLADNTITDMKISVNGRPILVSKSIIKNNIRYYLQFLSRVRPFNGLPHGPRYLPRILKAFHGSRALFPSLYSVHLSDFFPLTLPNFRAILSPNIRCIRIAPISSWSSNYKHEWTTWLTDVCESVPALCPNLEDFAIESNTGPILELPFSAIARMESARYVRIHGIRFIDDQRVNGPPPLPNLRSIQILVHRLERYPTPTLSFDFCSRLCASAIYCISIACVEPLFGPAASTPVVKFIDRIRPLMHLRNAKIVGISLPDMKMTLTDDDLAEALSWWPNVIAVQFNFTDPHDKRPRHEAPVEPLSHIRESCRKLRSIFVPQSLLSRYHELYTFKQPAPRLEKPATETKKGILLLPAMKHKDWMSMIRIHFPELIPACWAGALSSVSEIELSTQALLTDGAFGPSNE